MEDSNDKEEVLEEIVEMEEEVEIIEDVEIMEIEVITITDDENEEPQQKPKTEQQKKSDAEQKLKSEAGQKQKSEARQKQKSEAEQKQKSKDSGSQAPLTLRKAVPGIKGNEKSVPQSNIFFDCEYGRLMRCAKRCLPGTAKKRARKTDDSGVEAVNHVTTDKNGPQPSTSTVTTTVNNMVTPSTSTPTIINKTNPQLSTRIATTTTVEVNSGDATKIDYFVPDKSRGDFYCKKLNAGPVDAIVGSNFQYVDVEAKLMTELKDHESAIVGLDFITEKQFMSGVTNYECQMCNGRFSEADIIPHITSFKHRYFYVQKVDADWLKFKANSNGPSARVGTISDRTASLEKQFGQGKILVKIQKSDLSASQKLKSAGLSMKDFIVERKQSQAAYNSNNTSENTIRPGFNKEYLQEILRHNPTSEYTPKRPKKPKNAKRRLAPFVDTPGPDILVPVISEVADEVSTTVNATRPRFDNAYLQEVLRHNPISDYSSKHPKKQRFKKLPPKKKNRLIGPPVDNTPFQNISIRITPKKPFHKRRNFSPHETSPPHPLWEELNDSVAVPSSTFPQTARYDPPTPLQFPCCSSVPPQDHYEPPPLQFPSQQPEIACGPPPLQFPYDPPVSSQGYGLPPSRFPHESQQPQIACGPPSPPPQIPYEQPVSEPVPYDASQLPYNLRTYVLPHQPTYPSPGPTHSETVDFNGFGTNTSLYQSFQKSSTNWSILVPQANDHPVSHGSSNSQKRTLPEEFILKVIQLFPEYRRFQLLKKMAWSHIPNREELQRDFIIAICNSLIQYKISRFPEHSSLLLLKLELAKLQAASHDLSFERLFNHLQQKEYYYTHQNPSSEVDSSRFQDVPRNSNMNASTYSNVSAPTYGNTSASMYNVSVPVHSNTSSSVYSDMSVPTHSDTSASIYSNTNTTRDGNVSVAKDGKIGSLRYDNISAVREDNVSTTRDTNIHQHSERSNMTFSFQSTDE